MGGAVIITATLIGYLGSHVILVAVEAGGLAAVTGDPVSVSALLILFLMVWLGVVGFLDDFTKIRAERSLGLTSRQKLAGQTLVTVVFAALALWTTDENGTAPVSTAISFVRDTRLDLAFAGPVLGALHFLLWSNLLITGASNGVNLTDGLDGLATGACVMVFGAYTMISSGRSRRLGGDPESDRGNPTTTPTAACSRSSSASGASPASASWRDSACSTANGWSRSSS